LEKVHGLESDDQIPAKVALLQQQCTYLNAIDKLKMEADTSNREKRIAKFFDNTSAPREWVEEEYGKVNQMETLGTLRSRELREVYFALGLTSFDVDERLDILLHVKLIVQEFDSKLTREVADLLNREADLLLRGTKKGNLAGLLADPEYVLAVLRGARVQPNVREVSVKAQRHGCIQGQHCLLRKLLEVPRRLAIPSVDNGRCREQVQQVLGRDQYCDPAR